MDWNLAIEKNREALRRILAMLVSMAGLPVLRGRGDAVISDRPNTLPRHVHRLVLRLLRPAEAATRRLIIVAARGLVVKLVAARPRKAKPKPALTRRNGFGTGIVIRPGPLPEWARALAPKRSGTLSFPLFDPLKRFGVRHRCGKPSAMPRISFLDSRPFNPLFQSPRAPDPLPLSPDDPLDTGRLHRRLDAMALALGDLPRQAKRLARWQARAAAQREHIAAAAVASGNKDAGRLQRFSPMRPGHPPGWRSRPVEKVDEVLNELHGLAVWAMARPDTS